MKMTPENYATLRDAIRFIWSAEKHEAHRQFIINEGKAKDIEKRLRWDWFWYAQGWLPLNFTTEKLYGENGLNDDHIDTALRAIIKELTSA